MRFTLHTSYESLNVDKPWINLPVGPISLLWVGPQWLKVGQSETLLDPNMGTCMNSIANSILVTFPLLTPSSMAGFAANVLAGYRTALFRHTTASSITGLRRRSQRLTYAL